MIHVIGHVVGHRLDLVVRIAHRHADAGELQHRHVVAAVAERHRLLPGEPMVLHEAADAARLAAVGGDHIGEVGMPAHPGHVPAQADKLRLLLGGDERADLERLMRERTGMWVVNEPRRRGLAQLIPRRLHRGGDPVEIHVVAFAEGGDHVRIAVQPIDDHGHVIAVDRPGVEESLGVEAVLAVGRHNAVELDRQHPRHHLELRGRAARADEHQHAAFPQPLERRDSGRRNLMGGETGEGAVHVKEHGPDIMRLHPRNLPGTDT